jgi:hypothetical protein
MRQSTDEARPAMHSACIETAKEGVVMRCVIVNGAKLKAEVSCAHCGRAVGAGYVRDMRNRMIYCDFTCYRVAVGMPPTAFEQRAIVPNGWMRRS